MTIGVARGILLSTFIISFLIGAGSIFQVFVKSKIYSDSMSSMLLKLLSIYSAPLAVIIGGIFAQRNTQIRSVHTIAFWSAFILSAIWNILIVGRFLLFTLTADDTVGALTSYLNALVPPSYFLVMGGLSYFFAKQK